MDEEEIKIEYYDYFDLDPLENDKSEVDSNVTSVNLGSRSIEKKLTIIDHKVTNHLHRNDQVEKDDEYFDNINNLHKEELNAEPILYKEVDHMDRYQCKLCELSYSTFQTLRHHVKIKHPSLIESFKYVLLQNRRSRKLKCHICNEKFKFINDLEHHTRNNHKSDTKLTCRFCFAIFESEKNLINHMFNIHKECSNKKVHSCQICGYSTVKKSHINQHKKTHAKEKNFKCQYCVYTTCVLFNLKIHERTHTKDKPYKCELDDCDYCCSSKSALWSHQLKHNRETNMNYCDKCSYKTVYKQSLRKHIESHRRNTLKI